MLASLYWLQVETGALAGARILSAQPDAPLGDIIAPAFARSGARLAGAGSSALLARAGSLMKWQPVGGRAELERGVRQRVYVFIATIATSVRFFALSFFMMRRM